MSKTRLPALVAHMAQQLQAFLAGAEERLSDPARPDDPAEIRARLAALHARTGGATQYATGTHDRGLGDPR